MSNNLYVIFKYILMCLTDLKNLTEIKAMFLITFEDA